MASSFRDEFNWLMQGGKSDRVLFWEVWFMKHEMVGSRYGDPQSIESRIKMAQELGMAALSIGYIDTNCHFKEVKNTADGASRYAGGSLTDFSQLKKRTLPDWHEVVPELVAKQKRLHEAGIASVIYLPWCFHAVATSMGLENFAVTLYDDYDFMKACMRWMEERNRMAIERVVSIVKPDLVLFDGDCAYKTGLMVHPKIFRELVFDETLKTVNLLKDLNIPYSFHTDGKLDDVIPILIELGFAAVHGCEKQANDLVHLVEAFGDNICLIGNMDVAFLSRASEAEIRVASKEMIRQGMAKKKYIAACNTSPQDYIPDENYLAMCDVIRQFQ